MEGQPQFDPLEQCARCERPAPQAVPGPEGQSDQGWTTYESEQQLIVDVPYPDAGMLRRELATAIGEFEGIVSVQADPQVTAPAIREVVSHYAGIACPECQSETGWDWFEWTMFMRLRGD